MTEQRVKSGNIVIDSLRFPTQIHIQTHKHTRTRVRVGIHIITQRQTNTVIYDDIRTYTDKQRNTHRQKHT